MYEDAEDFDRTEIERLYTRCIDQYNDYVRLYKLCEQFVKAIKGDCGLMAALSNLEVAALLDDLENEIEQHFPCPF